MTDNSMLQNIHRANGVLYDRTDYAGFFRRSIAIVIDTVFLLLIGFTLSIFWLIISPEKRLPPAFFILWLVIAYLYLALLKPTKVRTLGFIVADLKIVDLEGKQPSLWTMTLSFLLLGFILLGPFYILLDLLWFLNDPNRQTFLDKAAGTYIVKQQAVPIVTGVQKTVIYHLLGFTFVFREVQPEWRPNTDLKQPKEELNEGIEQVIPIDRPV